MNNVQRAMGNRTPPVSPAIALVLCMTALLLVAGCTSEPEASADPGTTTTAPTLKTLPVRYTTTTIPPAVTMGEPEPSLDVSPKKPAAPPSPTISLQTNYHPDYIRMDATVYKVGEVVLFYLVNRGPEISGCNVTHPAYSVYHLSPDGTRLKVATHDPTRAFMTVISREDPGSSTGPFSLDTSRLSPGRYLIRFDCGNNVGREFMLLAR